MKKITQFRGWCTNFVLVVESPRALIEKVMDNESVAALKRCSWFYVEGNFVQQRFACKRCWTNSDCVLFNNIFQQCLLQVTPGAFEFCIRIIWVHVNVCTKRGHHETSSPLSVNIETRELNATSSKIWVTSRIKDENGLKVSSCRRQRHLSDGGGKNNGTRWRPLTATRADTHCQWVWVTIIGLIAKTKQAAIAALMSSGIQAKERWWNEAVFSIHRRQSGKIDQTKFIVQVIPNATLKEQFVQTDSDMGWEVTCDVRMIKEYQLENSDIFEPPPFRLSKIVRDEWTAWHKLWRNLGATENQIQCLILLDVEARIHEEAEEIEVWSQSYPRSLHTAWIGNSEQSVG